MRGICYFIKDRNIDKATELIESIKEKLKKENTEIEKI